MAEDRGDSPSPEEVEIEKVRGRFELLSQLISWGGRIGSIFAFSLIVYWIYRITGQLAGETTVVSVEFLVGLSMAIGGSALTAAVMGWRQRSQRHELIRLRERCDQLEKRLDAANKRGKVEQGTFQ